MLLLAGLALALSTLGAAAVAEEEASESRETSSPGAIPTSQVLSAADRAFRLLEALSDTFEPGPAVDRIEALLPNTVAAIDRQEKRAADLMERAGSFDAVDDLEAHWISVDLDLPVWRETLGDRITDVSTALETLSESQGVWQATRDASRKNGAPPAVTTRISEVLAALQRAIEAGTLRQSALLTVQAAVAAQEARIEEALDELRASRKDLVQRIFERESSPIWERELWAQLSENLGGRILEALSEEFDELREFLTKNVTGIFLQIGLFAALAALLFGARARVRRRSEEEQGLARVADIFEFPVPVALLLAILAAPSIYPYLPPLVAQALGAAALVPTILILRRLVPKQLYPLLDCLVGFYFVDRIRELAAPLPGLARVIFLVEMVTAALLLGWLLRPARLTEIPTYAARAELKILGFAGRFALTVLVLALIANAIGYGRLGDLVGSALLESAYIAVVAYASVRVFDSLVTFALRVRPLGRLHFVQKSRYLIGRRSHRALTAGAYLFWASATLGLLAVREPVWTSIREGIQAKLSFGSVSISLGDVLAFGLTVWGAFLFSRFLRFVLEEDVYPRVRLARGVPYAASTLIHYAVLLMGFLLAIAATGIDLDRFALLAGAFGVGIGFGLQNVVNNFVSGLILLWERPVQVGDMVEAGDAFGEMKRIGIRSSTVRTLNGAELIVPNAELISQRVTNWTLSDRQRRIDLPVGVAYGTDRRQVMALLKAVAEANGDVLENPPPVPVFLGFGDSSLDFELRVWTTAGPQGEFARVRSNVALEVGEALDAAGIEIPFPQRDVHIRSVVDHLD